MRKLARISRIQNLIHHIWLQHPDLRYGQLISNLYAKYMIPRNLYATNSVMYVLEDSEWEEFLINFKGFE